MQPQLLNHCLNEVANFWTPQKPAKTPVLCIFGSFSDQNQQKKMHVKFPFGETFIYLFVRQFCFVPHSESHCHRLPGVRMNAVHPPPGKQFNPTLVFQTMRSTESRRGPFGGRAEIERVAACAAPEAERPPWPPCLAPPQAQRSPPPTPYGIGGRVGPAGGVPRRRGGPGRAPRGARRAGPAGPRCAGAVPPRGDRQLRRRDRLPRRGGPPGRGACETLGGPWGGVGRGPWGPMRLLGVHC